MSDLPAGAPPPFDPNKPFERKPPPFDPNKPSSSAEPAAPQSSFWEKAQQIIMGSPEKPTMFGAGIKGAGQAIGDVGMGIGQLGVHMAPPVGGQPQAAQDIDRIVRQREAAYQASPGVRQHPIASGVGRFAGDVAATAPLMGAGAAVARPGMTALPRIGMGMAQGGAGAAVAPTSGQGDYWTEKGKQVAAGLTVGGAIPGIGSAIAPRLPGPGALSQMYPAVTKAFPMVRQFLTGPEERTTPGFQRMIARQVLDPIGGTITPRASGHDLARQVTQQFSQAYDRLLPNLSLSGITYSAKPLPLVQAISELPGDELRQFNTFITNRIEGRFPVPGGGYIDGRTFKQAQSDLTDKIARTENDELRHAYSLELKHLNDSLMKDNPQYAPDLSRINEGYAMMVRMRRAGAKSNGDFTPKDMLQAIKQMESEGSVWRGDSALQRLSELGSKAIDSPRASVMDIFTHVFTRAGLPMEVTRSVAGPVGRGLKEATPFAAPIAGIEAAKEEEPPPRFTGDRPRL